MVCTYIDRYTAHSFMESIPIPPLITFSPPTLNDLLPWSHNLCGSDSATVDGREQNQRKQSMP